MSVVLILVAFVLDNIADDLVIENLADRHTRVDLDRLHREHLERPIPAEPDIAKPGGDMHK